MRLTIIIIVTAVALLPGCNEGLNPNDVTEEGFGGTITFASALPPPDSLRDLRVVAVPYYPVDTTFSSVLYKVTKGIIAHSPSRIEAGDAGTSISYALYVPPKVYYYIAVVQQYGSDVFTQWHVVAVYGTGGTPKPVVVMKNSFVTGIDLTVDFYHLPPQPFRTP
jgi:hypothetical protein